MITVPYAKANVDFASFINKMDVGERYVFTKNHKPTAVLLSVEEVKLLDMLMEMFEDVEDVKIVNKRLKEKSQPIEELWKEIGIRE